MVSWVGPPASGDGRRDSASSPWSPPRPFACTAGGRGRRPRRRRPRGGREPTRWFGRQQRTRVDPRSAARPAGLERAERSIASGEGEGKITKNEGKGGGRSDSCLGGSRAGGALQKRSDVRGLTRPHQPPGVCVVLEDTRAAVDQVERRADRRPEGREGSEGQFSDPGREANSFPTISTTTGRASSGGASRGGFAGARPPTEGRKPTSIPVPRQKTRRLPPRRSQGRQGHHRVFWPHASKEVWETFPEILCPKNPGFDHRFRPQGNYLGKLETTVVCLSFRTLGGSKVGVAYQVRKAGPEASRRRGGGHGMADGGPREV